MSAEPHKEWHHGSPLVLNTLRTGSTVSPIMELAMAFAHNPRNVSLEVWTTRKGRRLRIKHDGRKDGYLYRVRVIDPESDLRQHPESTLAPGEEMLTRRDLKVELLRELPMPRPQAT